MWLLDYMTKNSLSKGESGVGDVTSSKKGCVSVNSTHEHRDVPIISPYGVAYNPPLNEKSVVIPLESYCACVGVVSKSKDLEPGEVMLYSKGGASITLKNDGTVLINGKVVE